eukprot:m51a1_g3409 hypothetical protein (375) ;mRNA; r:565555-566679
MCEQGAVSAALLRDHVVPHLARPRDLVALSLAFPRALAARCLARARQRTRHLLPPLLDALCSACSLSDACAVRALCEAPLADLLASLARSGAGARDASAVALWACFAHAAARRDRAVQLELESLPLDGTCLGLGEVEAPDALRIACALGMPALLRLAGAVDPAAARSEAPSLLPVACKLGHADAVRELARPPFSLVGGDARRGGCQALRLACGAGADDVVRALSEAPYGLGGDDARAEDNEALLWACSNGHASTVRLLSLPPWSLGAEDARARSSACVRGACYRGHADVLAVLAGEPYALGGADARQELNCALRWACQRGHADAVRVLSGPPYSLGREDALQCGDNGKSALDLAKEAGSDEVICLLSQPPFLLQ